MAYTTIDNPELYFQIKLYTGNGTDDTAITLDGAEDMAPNFVWIRKRNATEDFVLFDTVRGATKYIKSNSNAAEATDTGSLKSFDSDGFTLGTAGRSNNNTNTYVAWCWKAGTTSGISGSADITPSAYSISQAAGMSIIKYTGSTGATRTVLHGLGAAPDMIFIKMLDGGTNGWIVGGNNITSNWGGVLVLNNTAATFTNAYFGGAVPNSTTFSISNTSEVNSANTHIAYCFRSIQSYSKFGSYIGNANVNGPFVHLGFKPAWVMIKEASATSGWILHNDKMNDNINPMQNFLQPNEQGVESDNANLAVDFLSNGFKVRNDKGDTNTSGSTMIYMAFAEAPLVNSNGVPCTAR